MSSVEAVSDPLFDVYPRYDIEPVRGEGCYIWDKQGNKYLDLYGGHAVISIGHSHPHYVQRITDQLARLGFYSNSVQMPIQQELASTLARQSGYPGYALFLVNSGAEANENALKLASFHTGNRKIIAFEKAFHGRTSLAVEATDNSKLQAPVNKTGNVIRLPLNDIDILREAIDTSVAAVILEGIQGIAGVYTPEKEFISEIRRLCQENGVVLILDEIQSGYGRSGKFFAHQHMGIEADIITMAKGMGNGFPLGGVLISPEFEARAGLLGTTFGGNHLACAAGLAVLEVMEKENLMDNAVEVGAYLLQELGKRSGIREVRGMGLMLGLDLESEANAVRKELLFTHRIFTGSASNPHTLRILPPMTLQVEEASEFLHALDNVLSV